MPVTKQSTLSLTTTLGCIHGYSQNRYNSIGVFWHTHSHTTCFPCSEVYLAKRKVRIHALSPSDFQFQALSDGQCKPDQMSQQPRQPCVVQGLGRSVILALEGLKFFSAVRKNSIFSCSVFKKEGTMCIYAFQQRWPSFLLSVTAAYSRGTQSLLQLCWSIVLHTAGTGEESRSQQRRSRDRGWQGKSLLSSVTQHTN